MNIRTLGRQMRKDLPEFSVGDTVSIVKVVGDLAKGCKLSRNCYSKKRRRN